MEFGPAAQRWTVGAVFVGFSGVERVGPRSKTRRFLVGNLEREFVSPQQEVKVRDPLTPNSEGCHILVVTGILEFSHSISFPGTLYQAWV